MRLIDADAVLERIERDCDARCLYKDYKEPLRSKMCNCCELGDARMYVEDAPTVDAEPVVRCKDCKYMFTQGKTTKFYFCNEFEISVDETDYCAWGEKMDEVRGEEDERTPETDAMLKQLCIKECFVRCKECKQWDAELGCCTSYTIVKCTDGREGVESKADDFCSRGERRDES